MHYILKYDYTLLYDHITFIQDNFTFHILCYSMLLKATSLTAVC